MWLTDNDLEDDGLNPGRIFDTFHLTMSKTDLEWIHHPSEWVLAVLSFLGQAEEA
jgi:hypothetical protein